MNLTIFNASIACVTLAIAMTLTPGPNNAMLLSSGVNYGFRRSIPHILGISTGMPFLFFIVGILLKDIFIAYPTLNLGLEMLGILYLVYLAWHIARSDKIEVSPGNTQPYSFLQALLFQWINPKVWIMALVATTTVKISQNYLMNLLSICLIFMLVSLPCIATWAAGGHALKRFIQYSNLIKIFNYIMALLLLLSIIPSLKSLLTH